MKSVIFSILHYQKDYLRIKTYLSKIICAKKHILSTFFSEISEFIMITNEGATLNWSTPSIFKMIFIIFSTSTVISISSFNNNETLSIICFLSNKFLECRDFILKIENSQWLNSLKDKSFGYNTSSEYQSVIPRAVWWKLYVRYHIWLPNSKEWNSAHFWHFSILRISLFCSEQFLWLSKMRWNKKFEAWSNYVSNTIYQNINYANYNHQ